MSLAPSNGGESEAQQRICTDRYGQDALVGFQSSGSAPNEPVHPLMLARQHTTMNLSSIRAEERPGCCSAQAQAHSLLLQLRHLSLLRHSRRKRRGSSHARKNTIYGMLPECCVRWPDIGFRHNLVGFRVQLNPIESLGGKLSGLSSEKTRVKRFKPASTMEGPVWRRINVSDRNIGKEMHCQGEKQNNQAY
jgi:hypothetical protein